jgi:hypothetical protein
MLQAVATNTIEEESACIARRQKCRRTEEKCGEQSMAARKARVEKLGRAWRMVWPQQVGDGLRGVADGSPAGDRSDGVNSVDPTAGQREKQGHGSREDKYGFRTTERREA